MAASGRSGLSLSRPRLHSLSAARSCSWPRSCSWRVPARRRARARRRPVEAAGGAERADHVTRRARGREEDHARVRDQPRERELRDVVGRDVAGEVPQRARCVRRVQLLTQYFGIGHVEPRQLHRADQRAGAQPDTQTDCIHYTDFVVDRHRRVRPGARARAACTRKSVKTIGDQLHAAGKTWKAYKEDIANSATQPKTCRHPAIGVGRLDDRRDQDRHVRDASRPVGVLPLDHRLAGVQDRSRRPRRAHRPTSRRRRRRRTSRTSRRTCATTATTRRARTAARAGWSSADAFLQDVGAEDPRVTRVQGRRHARDHVRRGRARQGRRLDRVLPHAAVAEHRRSPGSTGPGGGRVGALVISSRDEAEHDERHALQPLRVAVQPGERVRAHAPRLRRRAGPHLLRQRRLQRVLAE